MVGVVAGSLLIDASVDCVPAILMLHVCRPLILACLMCPLHHLSLRIRFCQSCALLYLPMCAATRVQTSVFLAQLAMSRCPRSVPPPYMYPSVMAVGYAQLQTGWCLDARPTSLVPCVQFKGLCADWGVAPRLLKHCREKSCAPLFSDLACTT